MAVQSSVGRVGFIALIVAVIGYQSWVARSVLIAEDFRHEPAFWKQVGDAIPANTDVIALTQDYGYRLMLFGWRKVSLWPLSTGLSEARGGEQDAAGDFADLTEGKEYFLVTASGQLEKQPDLKRFWHSILLPQKVMDMCCLICENDSRFHHYPILQPVRIS
ncbi:hypothetical protein [Candidatus Villigracilis affinis]|uniref:hypothetical protein n=1 Tax=Candidatus Villigracilis affinis TaxID=3140682 RepID=UPI002A19C32A|nr:hypothetical protein [Anaerolineales bacterium]